MFDFKDLPVAPEFVEALQETAEKVIYDCLESGNASEDVINLVSNSFRLSFYILECHRDPKMFLADRDDRFDIETFVINTINLIANLGGIFHGAFSELKPRKGTVLASVKSKK